MSRRMRLPVTMELLSGAIFGSGFSVPGGEDVAVCQDEQGYPHIKGSTWKGLLRESLQNLAAWTGTGEADIPALLGREGWSDPEGPRRVRFTSLALKGWASPDKPFPAAEDCYDLRTFTGLEDSVVKKGSLHTAACVRRGLIFCGQLECAGEDLELLRSALAGVKWAGTQRHRGFGRVRFQTGAPEPVPTGHTVRNAVCLRYRLHSELPVLITDPDRSSGNSFETMGFIPGSTVRGAVIGRLAGMDPAWFAAHKKALLTARFLDAVPVLDCGAPLPSIRGFYEGKEENNRLDPNVATGAEVVEGHKRAKLGSFCTLRGDTLLYWGAKTGGALRIRKGGVGEDPVLFQVRYLEAGQDFTGFLLLDEPELAPKIAEALEDTLWLGADRWAGFGKCSLRLEAVDAPDWIAEYGYHGQGEIGTELYLLAVSPLTMLDDRGEPCGLEPKQLARSLGVPSVELRHCSAALTQNGSYNRTWQCRAPSVRMYDRGSLFHLICDQPPSLEAIRRVQASGLGVRRAEGFGQVLFLPPGRLDRLWVKEDARKISTSPEARRAAEIRRAKYRWVMEQAGSLRLFQLSGSQLGTIQTICQEAISRKGDHAPLYAYLAHNLNDRGVAHGARFREIDRLVRSVLETPLAETLGVPLQDDSVTARLELLCLLFDHSRKGKGGF